MEFEFDKEIDVLLRQTARDETVSGGKIADSKFRIPNLNHLDADEISALAENTLPEKTRRGYVLHLADCDRCRKNLSNLMTLNAAPESEIIPGEPAEIKTIFALPIPWYRRLFAVPTAAYAMGALILIFAGIAVFTVLQNKDSQISQVSQVSEKQVGGKGMSSDGDAATQEVFSSNSMSSNAATMNNSMGSDSAINSANLPMPSAPVMLANSNSVPSPQREPNQILRKSPTNDKTLSNQVRANQTTDSAAGDTPLSTLPAMKTEELPINGRNTEQLANNSQGSTTQNHTMQNQTQIMSDSRNVQRSPMPAAKMQKQESRAEESRNDSSLKSIETTSVGGKNFNRVSNIWIDSAYRGQTTTNISRGTKEYEKLDSGLRGIVENLRGAVIVVWKDRAFRIQ